MNNFENKGSTQQIAGLLLMQLATNKFEGIKIDEANDILKSIILLRDGGEFAYKTTKEFYWGTESSEGTVVRQGICLSQGDYFLSDFMVNVFEDESVLDAILKIYPNLNKKALTGICHLMYRLLCNIQFDENDNLSSVKNIADVDLNYWHAQMKKYFDYLQKEYDDETF